MDFIYFLVKNNYRGEVLQKNKGQMYSKKIDKQFAVVRLDHKTSNQMPP